MVDVSLMRPRRARKLIPLAIISALLLMLSPSALADSTCWRYRKSERDMSDLVAKARKHYHVKRLSLDPELSKAARAHTREMILKDRMYHTSSKVLGRRLYNWTLIGENIGASGTVEGLFAGFMQSPSHRDTTYNHRWRHVGIGILQWEGRLWGTVLFSTGGDPETTLNLPDCSEADPAS
ncbi:MAG TPA: CAP domain-containing protein [Actinomycetota bacterium]|nr:CAP domain-containing protein [Actinomycetota bacterium]